MIRPSCGAHHEHMRRVWKGLSAVYREELNRRPEQARRKLLVKLINAQVAKLKRPAPTACDPRHAK